MSMEEIMDASRGLNLPHNRPPTEPRRLIPILLFHTSFQKHRCKSGSPPPRLHSLLGTLDCSGGDNSEKILSRATYGPSGDSHQVHRDTLSLCIRTQLQHFTDSGKCFLCPGRELLGMTAASSVTDKWVIIMWSKMKCGSDNEAPCQTHLLLKARCPATHQHSCSCFRVIGIFFRVINTWMVCRIPPNHTFAVVQSNSCEHLKSVPSL